MPRPLLPQPAVLQWPDRAVDRLQSAGFLRQADCADRVACPVCDGEHVESVVMERQPDGLCRYFVYCPKVLRAEVPSDNLRQWVIDLKRLVGAVVHGMLLSGRCISLLPGRLWRLGKTPWRGRFRDVLFARGLEWRDAAVANDHIQRHYQPVVLVAERTPSEEMWEGRPPAIISLAEIASFDGMDIVLDVVAMAAIVADADANRDRNDRQTTDRRQFRLAIRRQIKAEHDTALTDDILVAAYKQHGSYRRAAEALCASGVVANRWAVERAVQRAGGLISTRR